LIAFGLLFHRVIALLIDDWLRDQNYSHGFLIVPSPFTWHGSGAPDTRRRPRDPTRGDC